MLKSEICSSLLHTDPTTLLLRALEHNHSSSSSSNTVICQNQWWEGIDRADRLTPQFLKWISNIRSGLIFAKPVYYIEI